MRLRIKNSSGKTIQRAGRVFPSDKKWKEYDIPEYRTAEVFASTQLEVKILSEDESASEEEPAEGQETNEDVPGGESEESPEETSEDDEGDEDDDEGDEVDLDTLDYRELQAMAQEYDIPANQSRDALIEALADVEEE